MCVRVCSYKSVSDRSLDLGARVEDPHGVDGGGDPGLMGQPVCSRGTKSHQQTQLLVLRLTFLTELFGFGFVQ